MQNSYRISGLANSGLLLENNIFLVILNATHTPPHLALSVNGKHFSLGVKGPVIEGDMKGLLSLIRQKNIPSLFVQLKNPTLFSTSELQEEIKKHFRLYPSVNETGVTCLTPIRTLCASIYDDEMKNVNLVFDLLNTLTAKNLSGSVFHFNIDHHVKNGNFFMPRYSFDDVRRSIVNSGNQTYA